MYSSLLLMLAIVSSFGYAVAKVKDGLKLLKIENGSVYEQLGLKKGDIIRKVNGEQLDSVDKMADLMKKSKEVIQLEFERNGKTEKIQYTLH